MGLISTEVEVGLNGQTVKYYEDLGYIIPRHKNRSGKMVPIRESRIVVKVSDLKPNSSVKVKVKCDKCGKESLMLYKDYLNHNHDGNTYCKYCAYELFMTGSNNPAWKDSKTDEERIATRNYPEYKDFIKRVLKRDNYTCQCCGDHNTNRNIEVHHIDGYDWYKDGRCDDKNGITLCSFCHSNFHAIYGCGGNTKEQFEEWIGRSIKLLKYENNIPSTRQVYCIEDNLLYNGVPDLADILGVTTVHIYNYCRSKDKHGFIKGKHYIYKDIYDSLSAEEILKYLTLD